MQGEKFASAGDNYFEFSIRSPAVDMPSAL